MSDKVLCPYCGTEMEKCVLCGWKFYECPECFAASPSEKNGCAGPVQDWETATELALRRYQPENRVLTFDEAGSIDNDQIVWCEGADGTYRFADGRHVKELISCNLFFTKPNYGNDWRVWLRKPTEEERKAAKWDA